MNASAHGHLQLLGKDNSDLPRSRSADRLQHASAFVEQWLRRAMSQPGTVPAPLALAIEEAVFPGEKRVHGMIAALVAEELGCNPSELIGRFAAAVELIQCSARVHAELSLSPGSDKRRDVSGAPSTALIGHALLNLAFDTLTRSSASDARLAMQLMRLLSAATRSMIDPRPVTRNTRKPGFKPPEANHTAPTGLFGAAAMGSALATGAEASTLPAWRVFGELLGQALATEALPNLEALRARAFDETPGTAEMQRPVVSTTGLLPGLRQLVSRGDQAHAQGQGWTRSAPHGADHLVAIDRALGFLRATTDELGVEHVAIGLDPVFRTSLTLPELRGFIRDRLHVDIGFDAGDEVFSSMLALQLLHSDAGQRCADHDICENLGSIIKTCQWNGRFRFFFATNGFAADTDCTGVAVAGLYEGGYISRRALLRSAGELLRAAAPRTLAAEDNIDPQGGGSNGALYKNVIMVYWEDAVEPGVLPRGQKHDAVVCANALYTLRLAAGEGLTDAGPVMSETLEYIRDHLAAGQYLSGTRYYPSPDTFLYFASRLCCRFADFREVLEKPLHRALSERIRQVTRPGDIDYPLLPLSLAQRIIAAERLSTGIDTSFAKLQLIEIQQSDGAWPTCAFWTLGRHPFYFGSRALTTLFALRAIAGGYQQLGPGHALPSNAR